MTHSSVNDNENMPYLVRNTCCTGDCNLSIIGNKGVPVLNIGHKAPPVTKRTSYYQIYCHTFSEIWSTIRCVLLHVICCEPGVAKRLSDVIFACKCAPLFSLKREKLSTIRHWTFELFKYVISTALCFLFKLDHTITHSIMCVKTWNYYLNKTK